MTMTMEEMEAHLKDLQVKFTRLEDINKIQRLQAAYSYYVTRMMKQEIVDCFSDHPDTALYWLEGAYLGKDAVRRYFGAVTEGAGQPPEFWHQVMPVAGVIDIMPSGDRAQGRWYTIGTHSLPTPGGGFRKSWVAGMLENEYIKESGAWKFLKINWQIPYTVTIPDDLWHWPDIIGERLAGSSGVPGARVPPKADIPFDPADPRFLAGYVLPYHYPHPVTGKPTSEGANNERVIQANQDKS
jgi:hypothetical protein